MMLSGEESPACRRLQYPWAEALQTALGPPLSTAAAAAALSRGLAN